MASGVLLGPLTTTWTMPQTCSVFMPACSTCDQGFNGQSCNPTNSGRIQDNTACWPPATQGVSSPSWPFYGWGFYSPGLACPAGYTSACTAVYGQRATWATQFTLVPSETAVGCCPTGFTCNTQGDNTCMQTITQSTTFPTAYCSDTDLASYAIATFPTITTVTTTETGTGTTDVESSTSTRTMVLYAPMFQLNFHSSDLATSTTTSSTASSTASETGSGNGTSSKSSGGLSDGAKIGLGVGIGLGVAFLLAFGAFIYYYRRSRHNAMPIGSELPNNQISVEDPTPKTPNIKQSPGQVYEMGEYHAPAELPGNPIEGGYQDSPRGSDAHRYA
ncbi:uncharacterized protein TrAFT101_002775 [Trichoderma asperellum]|uniref:Mid2 domain-containing protein n=1 Tax=Trichoderma asperellum (strain ATCC 204424 / CBS 433.97 / NBRC 101777) TaxID=1042311 RepID=A0A2T3ZHC1_TRIA4|nr:hypothetical protein M441DRAFT_55283 [Trichoderma asperellum CBS 433.97]PTB44215.1 hypothetical protein M441DRAFT_55283 [Trichoderma asperellum CBS 433.97]UKZ86956.1 hypothetical protein TrAFT101_002775 [Trichoderma asperellum]